MSARRGFTLLEVLVALSIFALAAVVLGTAYVNVLNSYAVASRLNEGREEVSFARSLLLAEAELKKVEEGGEFDSVGKWEECIGTEHGSLRLLTCLTNREINRVQPAAAPSANADGFAVFDESDGVAL